jgi:hypothetical protein
MSCSLAFLWDSRSCETIFYQNTRKLPQLYLIKSLIALTPAYPLLRDIKLIFLTSNSPDRHGHEIVSEETGGRAPFFSRLGYGGNRSPEPVEGNAEGASIPCKQVAEKTSP